MTRCDRHQENITALADGALGILATLRLHLHLASCRVCAAVADARRSAVAVQRNVLSAPVEVDCERMLAEARRAIAALGEPTPFPFLRAADRRGATPWNWAVLAGVGGAAATAGLFAWLVSPSTVLVPLGLGAPPAVVASKPELFRDYEIIRELDALEHFDSVNRVRLEDSRPAATKQRRRT